MNALVTQTRKTLFARVVFNLCEMKRSEKEKGKIFSFLLMKRQKERNMYEEKKKTRKTLSLMHVKKEKKGKLFYTVILALSSAPVQFPNLEKHRGTRLMLIGVL